MTLGLGKQLLFIDRDMYKRHGSHILIVGATGSGKSSSLMKVAYNLYKVGETVIWRDDANLEFFGFLKVLPVKCFLPEGCTLKYRHENLEFVHYNPQDLSRLFPQFENDRLNVLLFDLFSFDHEVTIKFWVRFFHELYRYKRARIHEPWSLVIDELNDLAPGTRRGYIKNQLILASNIFHSTKKFRKMNLRLVGTTHNYNDLHPPLRAQFDYYIFKSMRREMVPERFWRYASLIEKLPVDQAIIVDRTGHFQIVEKWTEYTRHHSEPGVMVRLSPKRVMVPFDGEVSVEEADTSAKATSAKWRTRALKLARILYEHGLLTKYSEFRDLLGLSEGYAWRLFKKVEENDLEASV